MKKIYSVFLVVIMFALFSWQASASTYTLGTNSSFNVSASYHTFRSGDYSMSGIRNVRYEICYGSSTLKTGSGSSISFDFSSYESRTLKLYYSYEYNSGVAQLGGGYRWTTYNRTYYIYVAGHSHSFNSVSSSKSSTCSTEGYTIYKCSCGETKKVTEPVSQSGHRYYLVSGSETVKATCTGYGKGLGRCTYCGKTTEVSTAPLGHLYDGAEDGFCNRCNYERIDGITHLFGSWYTEQRTTCTTDGLRYRSCYDCGMKETEESPATGHSYGDFVVRTQPTCTQKGQKTKTCTACYSTSSEDIPQLNHKYGSWKTENAGSCTVQGTKIRTCSLCNNVQREKLPLSGHNYVKVKAVAATCKKNGRTEGEACSKCGDVKKQSKVIKAKGCKNKAIKTVRATTKKNGYVQYKCSVCNKVTKKTTYYAKKVKLSTTSYTYNGKVKKPKVTVYNSKNKKLKSGTDYTVTYSKGRKNVGRYDVTVTLKGKYKGKIVKTFDICPKGTKIVDTSGVFYCNNGGANVDQNDFTIKWKKQTKYTSGYEIQESKDIDFKPAKTYKVSGNKKTSLSYERKSYNYWYRIRTYKTVKYKGKKVKIYSKWSMLNMTA